MLNSLLILSLSLETSALKRWRVQDYHRMSELGILDPNERTELLAGQIIPGSTVV
jgi:hypothetical protein